ncbi:hypothetical protein [Marinicella rhabdoformis]|uniref:hypothetical protein n=1 Tax=Marinicella rhabdoformis TaxID=2580566 RepID=UPI0012AED66D|nr:hypothetical protein [Marinicella rhabdoformis]
MKKTTLLLVTLLMSQKLFAVNISQTGQGEFLLIPYYTVNNQYNTTVNVFNHDNKGKAIKIHIRESINGISALSYNVYLAPEDSWTFALGLTTDSVYHPIFGWQDQDFSTLVSFDNSCAPILNKAGHKFSGEAFQNVSHNDNVPLNNLFRTSEGFIEVVEMATVDPNSELHQMLLENQNGLSSGCQSIADLWQQSGPWQSDSNQYLLPPTGTLSAEATLINTPDGIQFPMEATVFENFFEHGLIHHTVPTSPEPTLNNGSKIANLNSNGLNRTLKFEHSVDAISALLMKKGFSSQYTVTTANAAETDTAITIPTKRFYLQNTNLPPFLGDAYSGNFINHATDRNGLSTPPGGSVMIPPPPRLKVSGTTGVLKTRNFRDRNSKGVLHSKNSDTISPVINNPGLTQSGIHNLYFDTSPIVALDMHSNETIEIEGSPIIGTTFQKATNANAAPGKLAQYGYSTPLKNILPAKIE